jgi:hypothetical protein
VIRYLADASLRHSIVLGCRRRELTLDFQSAAEARLEGLPDPAVLAIAAANGRILVTQDFQTMPLHFGNLLAQGRHSPGVLLISQRRATSAAIEALIPIWEASEESEWADRIVEIPFRFVRVAAIRD